MVASAFQNVPSDLRVPFLYLALGYSQADLASARPKTIMPAQQLPAASAAVLAHESGASKRAELKED